MAGIEDMIELFRGESKLRAPLAKGFAENSGKYYTPQKSFARHIAQGGSMSQGNLIGDLTGKVKSIYCSKVDAVALLEKEEGKAYLNFANDNNKIAGGRCKHLKGKILISELNEDDSVTTHWDKIYLKD